MQSKWFSMSLQMTNEEFAAYEITSPAPLMWQIDNGHILITPFYIILLTAHRFDSVWLKILQLMVCIKTFI